MPTHVHRPSLALRVLYALLAGAGVVSGLHLAAVSSGTPARVMLLQASLCAAAGVRSWQVRVESDATEVRFVDWLRVVHVPWGDVEHVGFDGQGLWVIRRSGRIVRAGAFRYSRGQLDVLRGPGRVAARSLEAARLRQLRERPDDAIAHEGQPVAR